MTYSADSVFRFRPEPSDGFANDEYHEWLTQVDGRLDRELAATDEWEQLTREAEEVF